LIFPVEVFGSSPNSTSRGTLKPASVLREKAISSSAVTVAFGARHERFRPLAPFLVGDRDDRGLEHVGVRTSARSTSIVEMFSPPEMMQANRSLSEINGTPLSL